MARRTWIKIYTDKWLRGSIRKEPIEVRAIFIDLLTLAGDSAYGDNGEIKLAEDVGFTDEVISGILNISKNIWLKVKEKLTIRQEKEKRIEIIPMTQGFSIKIINWKKYQSEYQRQKPYRKLENKKEEKLQPKLQKKLQGDIDIDIDIEKNKHIRGVDKQLHNNIKEIFNFWKKELNHPQAKLTKDRKIKIGARLKEGYTIKQCKKAILGCKASAYHMGDNKDKKIYDSIELIFRKGDKLEQFINYAENKKEEPIEAYLKPFKKED